MIRRQPPATEPANAGFRWYMAVAEECPLEEDLAILSAIVVVEGGCEKLANIHKTGPELLSKKVPFFLENPEELTCYFFASE